MSEVKAWMQEKFASESYVRERRHAHLAQPRIYRVIVVQLLLSFLFFVLLQPLGITAALSALLGGLCYTIPNAYFVRQAFRYRGARSAKLIASSFYRGKPASSYLLLSVLRLFLLRLNRWTRLPCFVLLYWFRR